MLNRLWNRVAFGVAALVSSSAALGGTDGFIAIPTADVLPHTAYQIFGQIGWHRVPENGDPTSVFPWVSGVRFGLFDRSEFSVEMGRRISLSGKMRFVQEEDWLPSISFGARQIFNSQEAHFYSVPDSLRDAYAGELFLTASKTFFGSTSIHGGASVIPNVDSGTADPFWGIAQPIAGGVALVYDGFYRHGEAHHNAGLTWAFRDILRVTIGATEVKKFFYQNGGFGFFTRDRETPLLDAYNAPGLYACISFTGFMRESMHPTTQARLDAVEKRLNNQTKRFEILEGRQDRTELGVQGLRGGGTDSVSIKDALAERILNDLVKGIQNESWDPRQSRKLQDSLLAVGEVANRLLVRTALRESSSLDFRLASLRVMGGSHNPRFVGSLSDILALDEVSLQREAVLALAKIGTPEALDILRAFRPKAQGDLLSLVDMVIKTLAPPPAPLIPTAPLVPATANPLIPTSASPTPTAVTPTK